MNLTPLFDKIIVERDEAEGTTKGGIVLPDSAKDKPKRGKILSVGTGRITDDGKQIAMSLKEGQRILFASHTGTEVDLGGKKVLIMSESNVLALFRD